MGECLITRRGGEPAYKLPILNEGFPVDTSVSYDYGGNTSATFRVEVAIEGRPKAYSYQWYVDDVAVSGANSATFTKTDCDTEGSYSVYCKITNKAGVVTSRKATLTVTIAPITLYSSGNEYADITGGWVGTSSGGKGSYTKNSTSLQMSATAGQTLGARFYTGNKIDLTYFDTLKATYSAANQYGQLHLAVDEITTEGTGGGFKALVSSSDGQSGTLSLDVSKLSGLYYVIVIGGTGYGNITKEVKVTKVEMS